MHKRSILLLGSLLLSTSLMACGLLGGSQENTSGDLSKQESVVLNETLDDRLGEPEPERQSKENDTITSKWGPDSATAVRKYSLYKVYYKQNNYQSAYKPWKWMIRNAPRQSVNLYIRGVNILEFKITKASMGEKDAYIDSLMALYDQRIKYFGEKGYVLGRKGRNLLQLDPGQAQKAHNILEKAIDLQGEEAEPYVPYYYVYAATQLREQEKLPREQLLASNRKAMDVLKANLDTNPEYKKMKNKVEGLMSDYLSCSDLISRYRPKLENQSVGMSKLKEFRSSLQGKGCTNDPFFLKINEKLFEKEPSPDVAASLGSKWKAKKNTDKAIKYYKKAIELEEKGAESATHALSIASLYKEQKSNLPKAAEYAKKAISMNEDYGKAYLLLGDIYVSGKDQCSDDFQQKAVHWLAVDYYQKAKEADESIAEKADMRIKSYRRGFPGKEKIFFKELQEGDSFTVECWINETTTVRIPGN